ncbi:MAG: hypothetical protein WCJ97_12020 [Phycisphaerae bacterium]
MLGLVLLTLLVCALVGCANNQAVALVNRPERCLVVVPVKGQPVIVRSIHEASVIGLGIIGGQIEQAATNQASETLCARLNQHVNFNGERIMAEECVKLLRASSRVAFHEVVVHPQDARMPGVAAMESNEQKRFKVNCTNVFAWNDNFSAWKTSPPVISNPPSSRREVFLEVSLFQVILYHRDQLAPMFICIRMVDPETGQYLRMVYATQTYDITPVTEVSDLQIFDADFRKCIQETVRGALHDLDLL